MTVITSPTPGAPESLGTADSIAPEPYVPRTSGARFLTAAGQTARRTLLQFFRTPQLLMMGTIQGALFLFMFRYIFGGAIDTGGGVSYVDFLVPGFLLTTILWAGMSAPAGVAEDAASGVHDRLRSLPIARTAVVVGRSLADTALVSWSLLVTTFFGFAVGFRTHAELPSVVLAFGVILVATYAFTWFFISLGLAASNAQAAQAMTMLVVPLTFMSSAYVPVDSMPGWMQPVAANQPVSAMINAVRSLMLGGTDAAGVGHTTGYWVVLTLVWSAAIAVVFGGLAVSRFARAR